MKAESGLNIPVGLFLFKRRNSLSSIFDVLEKVAPRKLYLLADGGRNSEESLLVEEVRAYAEKRVNWNCEVMTRYSCKNIGVYQNIALGVKYVFEREDSAIFLEDDNLPSISFFSYCKELLAKYENDPRVLWVCGTNYLTEYNPPNGSSYMFTRQLLPCGWASWGKKFLRDYDFDLKCTTNQDQRTVKRTYLAKRLFYQQLFNVLYEKDYYAEHDRYYSWDYHMSWSIRNKGRFGVSPCVNLIENIGVDNLSEHGGVSLDIEMTNRFCSMPRRELCFPLVHPNEVQVDLRYESEIEKKILFSFKEWLGLVVKMIFRKFFGIPLNQSVRGRLGAFLGR